MSVAVVAETLLFGILAPAGTAETKAGTEDTTNTATMEVAAVVAELGTAKTAATTRAGTTRAKVAGARTTETPATEAAMGAVRCEEVITIPTVVADHTEEQVVMEVSTAAGTARAEDKPVDVLYKGGLQT